MQGIYQNIANPEYTENEVSDELNLAQVIPVIINQYLFCHFFWKINGRLIYNHIIRFITKYNILDKYNILLSNL